MVWSAIKYPTLAEIDELTERLGLSDRQIRMWFYHRREKYKNECSRKKSLKVSAGHKRRMIIYSSDDESESDAESDADSGKVSPSEYREPLNAAGLFCW